MISKPVFNPGNALLKKLCKALSPDSRLLVLLLCIGTWYPLLSMAAQTQKIRIAIVDSYHPEYIWSQQTNDGVVAGLLEFGYLDTDLQVTAYTDTYQAESSRAIIKKYWMDSKRKKSRAEITLELRRITDELTKFKPDIILLGDDNAAKYVGNHYLDTDIPVVFWGVNGEPLKYGLLDSVEQPGHNITGIYQAGYHLDCVRNLQRLLPHIKTIAVLSDDSPTGRAHAKMIKRYGDEGSLPATVIKVVITNSYSQWQKEALALQDQVDAFFISNHNTLDDDNGQHVNDLDAAAWFLENIHKPSTTPSSYMVKEGFLATVDDAGFDQGFEATKIAHSILSEGRKPAEIASYAPDRGPVVVNRWRARMLGIEAQINQHADIIDEFVEDSAAWKHKSDAD